MISTAWIALSLALLQIPEFRPSVVPLGEVGNLGDSVYVSSTWTSWPIRGFATLSILSVPAHLVATSLGLKGLRKWAFGILIPALLLDFWNYYAVGGPNALGFWGGFQIGLIVNGCGFLMVNTLFSIPTWLKSDHTSSREEIQTST